MEVGAAESGRAAEMATAGKEFRNATYEHLARIGEVSPRAAILEAWREVEVASVVAAAQDGVAVNGKTDGNGVIRALAEKRAIPPELRDLYEQLRELRNKAAESKDFTLPPEEAERYVNLALGLAALLRSMHGKM